MRQGGWEQEVRGGWWAVRARRVKSSRERSVLRRRRVWSPWAEGAGHAQAAHPHTTSHPLRWVIRWGGHTTGRGRWTAGDGWGGVVGQGSNGRRRAGHLSPRVAATRLFLFLCAGSAPQGRPHTRANDQPGTHRATQMHRATANTMCVRRGQKERERRACPTTIDRVSRSRARSSFSAHMPAHPPHPPHPLPRPTAGRSAIYPSPCRCWFLK